MKTEFNYKKPYAPIVCPVCSGVQVHPSSVVIHRGKDGVRIDHSGVQEFKRECHERGAQVFLEFHCEDGHRYALKFAFHKGVTSSQIDDMISVPTDNLSSPAFCETLWRD